MFCPKLMFGAFCRWMDEMHFAPAREGGKSSPSATTRAGGALRLRRGGPEQVCHRACARSRACARELRGCAAGHRAPLARDRRVS